MNLQSLPNPVLIENTRALSDEERKLAARMIEHLEEISSRKLHLEMGYPSLFEFCLRELKYSEGQAHRRISAMRVAQEIPEVKTAIETGRLLISNVASAQRFFRQEKKSGKVITLTDKKTLLMQLEGKSTRECEKTLAAISPERPPEERVRPVTEKQSVLTMTVSHALLDKIARLKCALAYASELSTADLLERLVDQEIKRIEKKHGTRSNAPVLATSKVNSDTDGSPESDALAPPPEQVIPRNRHIPRATQREVRATDGGRCTYVSKITGRHCGSTYALELDHLLPYSLGGSHAASNLRLLCRAHHRARDAK